MGEADRVVGQFQVGVQVHFTAAPDGVIAVLVTGEIVEMCHHYLAVRVGRIGAADKVGAGDTEGVVGPGAAVEHQAIEIGVGDVAAELPQPGPSGPGIGASLRAQERPYAIGRKGHPEACGIRTRGHIIPVDVIRIGDPECRCGIVRGKQDMLGFLAILILDRQKKARRYQSLFQDLALTVPGFQLPFTQQENRHIYHQFVIRAPMRDRLRQSLLEEGIGTEVYYPVPLHLQECYAYLKHQAGDFPASEKASEEVLALPIYPELKDDQQDYVVDCIKAFYKR